MLLNKNLKLLKRLLSGKLSIKELSDIIDDRLFELRRVPSEPTDEEALLAGIELIIEEIEDCFRTESDLTEHIRSLLQTKETVISR